MPYRGGHYYNFGRSYACIYYPQVWFPGGGGDFNDPVRNSITYAYFSLFGRYGELGGVEGYVYSWVYGTGRQSYGTITNMVRAGGDRNVGGSGEWNDVQRFGRHTGMSTGTCPILGCTDPAASNYNRNATRDDGSCTYPRPTASISASPLSIIRGQSITVSWSTSNATSASITGIGSVSPGGGSVRVSPFSTTTYTLTASGRGGSASSSVTVRVYIPPIVTLTLDTTTIVRGQSTTLRWSTTGDASTLNISPGIGNTNLSSFISVSPTITTTYRAYASGLGGTDSEEITLTVLQPPVVDINGPVNVDYNSSVNLTYSGENVVTSFSIQPTYVDILGNVINGELITLPTGTNVSGNLSVNIPWNNFGPKSLQFTLQAQGFGNLSDSETIIIPVNIDIMPDVIDIPQSEDKIRDEEPVVTPDVEVTTEQILINDIDIPVEIKANAPVQVEFDNNGNWTNIRQL